MSNTLRPALARPCEGSERAPSEPEVFVYSSQTRLREREKEEGGASLSLAIPSGIVSATGPHEAVG